MSLLQATSVASPLLPSLTTSSGTVGVLQSFARVVNLEAEDGHVVSLVTPEIGPGPFHILLPVARLPRLSDTLRGTWEAGQLHMGPLQVKLAGAMCWDPTLAPLATPDFYYQQASLLWAWLRQQRRPESLIPVAADLWGGTAGAETPALVAARMGPRSPGQGAIQRQLAVLAAMGDDRTALLAGCQGLVGLGGGLTPAGDDCILGLAAALHLLGQAPPPLALPPGCTTTISRAFLQAALRGHFAAPWHALRTALHSATPQAVLAAAQTLLSYGATSGADALVGFLLPAHGMGLGQAT